MKGARLLQEKRISLSLVAGLTILAIVILFGLVGRLLIDPHTANVGSVLPKLSPSFAHPFGTDAQGRELLTLLVLGTPQTLKMGVVAGVVGVGVGLALGLIGGYFRGTLDALISLVSDSLMTIPAIAILVIIAANVETMTVELMGFTVAVLAWMFPTRMIRSQVLSIRERAYIEVARVNGESEMEILFREVMPNLLPFIAASFVGAMTGAIVAAIGLEALGLGAQEQPTLGTTIYWSQQSAAVLRGLWWWWGPPIVIIGLIFTGLFLVSVGLDRLANPRATAKP